MNRTEYLYRKILASIDMSESFTDDDLTSVIHKIITDYSKEHYLSLGEKAQLGKELFNTFRKLDVLQEYLEDDDITEIMINGTRNIFCEKDGTIYLTDKRFYSKERLLDIIQKIVSGVNRSVNEYSPIADARLEDGSRINVVLNPVALNGPIVTIRKFPKETIRMRNLLRIGSINTEIVKLLEMLVISKYNIFISGGTGSGKTTFLNALSEFIPEDERVIVIEDNAEIQIINIPNLVSLEARNANTEGLGAIHINDLIKAALRMRPDSVLVGEVRGEETVSLLQAVNTGHSGSISTGHSNSARDMLTRIETMYLMGLEIPLPAIRRQIASGFDIIVHLGRMRDKSRKLLEVVEIVGFENNEIVLNPLYKFTETSGKGESVEGNWEKCGELIHKEKMLAAGFK
ncbi:MAG: CpaF family protein [Suipraeoptans sp.]